MFLAVKENEYYTFTTTVHGITCKYMAMVEMGWSTKVMVRYYKLRMEKWERSMFSILWFKIPYWKKVIHYYPYFVGTDTDGAKHREINDVRFFNISDIKKWITLAEANKLRDDLNYKDGLMKLREIKFVKNEI